MENSKKRKVSEENRTFNATWADSFAFTVDETGLPVCLICYEKHAVFAQKYTEGDERKKAVSELMQKVDLSKNHFKKWMKSANSSTYDSFVAA